MVDADEELRDGKADEEGAEDAAAATQPDGLLVVGAGPANRVLFLSLKTRFECFCDGAAFGMAGFVVAAVAQPLELVVAPCMPLRPGRLG